MYSVPITPAQTANNAFIPGGFIIKARKIEESEIAHAAPAIREIWDWILMQCNHKDNPALNIRRGQCVRKIADIQDGLHWFVGYRKETYSKTQCENALEWLRKRQMITTTKTTRGLIITVCKYDSYNKVENYEYNSEDGKKTTGRQQQGGTINKNGNNANNENSAFDVFWDKYNFKRDRPVALKAWNKLSKVEQDKAIEHIPTYYATKPDWQNTRYPATYLNKKTWLDEAPAQQQPQQDLGFVDYDEYLGRPAIEDPFKEN
jgi:hypothetical protein